jgi:citrate synthase
MSDIIEKIRIAKDLVSNYEGMKDFYISDLAKNIEFKKAKMLSMYPDISTTEALMKVIEEYTGKKITAMDCSFVNTMIGLPELLHTVTDMAIVQSIFASYESGKMDINNQTIQNLFIGARQRVALNILSDTKKRVLDEYGEKSDRIAALMEFGIDPVSAEKTIDTGAGSLYMMVDPKDIQQGWVYRGMNYLDALAKADPTIYPEPNYKFDGKGGMAEVK